MPGAALTAFIASLGWQEDGAGLVTVPLNEENQPKREAVADPIHFERTTVGRGSATARVPSATYRRAAHARPRPTRARARAGPTELTKLIGASN